jgi:hypothetical protein
MISEYGDIDFEDNLTYNDSYDEYGDYYNDEL